jgi:hypothetical protein
MAGFLASITASIAGGLVEWLLSWVLSSGATLTMSFVVGSIVFVASYVGFRKLRDQIGL